MLNHFPIFGLKRVKLKNAHEMFHASRTSKECPLLKFLAEILVLVS